MKIGTVILFFGLPLVSSMFGRPSGPDCRATGITAKCRNVKFISSRIEKAMKKAMKVYKLPRGLWEQNELSYIGYHPENGHEICYPLTMTRNEITASGGIQAFVYLNQVCRFSTVMQMFSDGQFTTHNDCEIIRK
ncbi:unnamed protein product [Blumeria hordei]|uniref:Uncharacterized protein n=1 Tax=Blumeria hordei TaxID=2867405 RepID=A0A383URT6_BLUHO|nr:unnamed protein product [Blumeria hordei]SZF02515.1 unnamed protein product [Blumeria hordei]